MQKKAITTGTGATQDLDAATLGYDPGDYAYHYIQVFGSGSETFSIKAKAEGASVFAACASLASQAIPLGSMVALTPDHAGGFEALQVSFSGSVTGYTVLVASMNRPGLGER